MTDPRIGTLHLNEVKPDVLPFSGHGDDMALAFEDADGGSVPLDAEHLERLIAVARPRLRLVVFNSCDSAALADAIRNRVDLAIGMEATIEDSAAKSFAAQFYNSLGFGVSVAEAYRQAALQMELAHGRGASLPRLFARDGVDPESVVLVNPGDGGGS
jgi:hypothetical protein